MNFTNILFKVYTFEQAFWLNLLILSVPRIVAHLQLHAQLQTHMHLNAHAGIHSSPSSFLKIVPYFHLISTGEELSQPTKHASKIIILYL